MIQLKNYISVFLILIGGVLSADLHPPPGQWSLSGDFLYLLPSINDTYFVIDGTSATRPIGKRMNNDFGFEPGFRVGGEYTFCGGCNRGLQAFYTRLQARTSKTVRGGFLWPTVGSPDLINGLRGYSGFAASDLNLSFQSGEGLFVQEIGCFWGVNLYLQGGLEGVTFHLDQAYTFQNGVLAVARESSKMWGLGPQVGMELDYVLCHVPRKNPNPFSIVCKGAISLLTSQTEENVVNVRDGATILDFDDKDTWRLVPALKARAGLNYAFCLSDCAISLEFGYEFSYYSRMITRIQLPDDTVDSLSYLTYYDFAAQGLYVSGSISF